MVDLALPSLTNSQVSSLPRGARRRGLLTRMIGGVREWRHRVRERELLASLSDRELADFGATRADVYRELSAQFWRALPPC